jgi:hypothetical protein
MKSSRPPLLATWLLEHLLPKGKGEVLAGDLLEQFDQEDSDAWYWRQVLGAILVSSVQELYARRIALLWAILYSMAVPWIHIWPTTAFHSLFIFSVRLRWPLSQICQITLFTLFNFVLLVIALGAYQVVARKCGPRRFSRALLFALPTLILGNTAFLAGLALPIAVLNRGVMSARVPLLLGLLISMWIVSSGPAQTDSQSVRAQD